MTGLHGIRLAGLWRLLMSAAEADRLRGIGDLLSQNSCIQHSRESVLNTEARHCECTTLKALSGRDIETLQDFCSPIVQIDFS